MAMDYAGAKGSLQLLHELVSFAGADTGDVIADTLAELQQQQSRLEAVIQERRAHSIWLEAYRRGLCACAGRKRP